MIFVFFKKIFRKNFCPVLFIVCGSRPSGAPFLDERIYFRYNLKYFCNKKAFRQSYNREPHSSPNAKRKGVLSIRSTFHTSCPTQEQALPLPQKNLPISFCFLTTTSNHWGGLCNPSASFFPAHSAGFPFTKNPESAAAFGISF